MKIYVAGPMRGIPEFNFPAFHAAAAKLRADGHHVFNPAERDIETHGVDISKGNPPPTQHETPMTTPKEALERARTFVSHAPGSNAESTLRMIDEAIASLEGDAVERVAGLLRKFHRDSCYPEAMAGELNAAVNAILATGLVAGEAAIRADEREKCARIADAKSDAVMAEAEAAHEDKNYNLHGRLECQAGDYADLAAAIRSGGTNER
ncbi:MAG: DUF4406 domain-containing protein [Mycobacterium sp.]